VPVSAATRFSATDDSVSRLDPILVCPRCRLAAVVFGDHVSRRGISDHSIVAGERRLPRGAAPTSIVAVFPGSRPRARPRRQSGRGQNCERFLAALRRLKSRPRMLIMRGGLDGSGTGALYQAPISSASAPTSAAPNMLRSSAAATICPLPMVASTACGFNAVYFLGRVFSRAAC
jgi:hypothetical protein